MAAGKILGSAIAKVLPSDTAALVPVPRAVFRRMQYGVDPAVCLAQLIAAAVDVPLSPALRAHMWWPAHAGMDKVSRRSPRFSVVGVAPPGSVLIDDVLTTGTTLAAAGRLLGIERAVTATRAGR